MLKGKNFLDYTPVRNPKYEWRTEENDLVTIIVPRHGIFCRLLKLPKNSYITLDDYGSFIWQYIDGHNTIFDISEKLNEKYGKDVEPLYNRIVQYFKILRQNNFIKLNL